jgi:hypothetical protein
LTRVPGETGGAQKTGRPQTAATQGYDYRSITKLPCLFRYLPFTFLSSQLHREASTLRRGIKNALASKARMA